MITASRSSCSCLIVFSASCSQLTYIFSRVKLIIMSRLDDDAWLESVWVSLFVKLVSCCKKLMMISRSSLGFVCFAAVLHAPQGPTATSQYEHSSIPATVKKLFNLPGPFLTARDAWAGTFESVFSLSSPRTDCPCKKNQLQLLMRPNYTIYIDLHHKDDQNLPCCFCCWKLRSWIFFMESEACCCCCCLPSAGCVARSGVASCSFITATIASERRWQTVRVSRRVVDTSCILERRSCTQWLHHSQDSVYLHHASDCQFLRRCFCCLWSWSSP